MTRYRFVLMLLAGVMFVSTPSAEQEQVDLSSYQWKRRLLILFAPSEKEQGYQSLREQIERRFQEVQGRDLVIFHIFETGESHATESSLTKGQVFLLRKQFSIKSGQRIAILIGKDGEVKLRKALPADLSEIFSVIDAMPMRQREIREQGK